MHLRRHITPTMILAALAIGGCADEPVGPDDPAANDPRLGGGLPTGLPDLMPVGDFIGCTGTLIGPRTVLTAGHCLSSFGQGCVNNPPRQSMRFADEYGNPWGANAQTIAITGWAIHPDFYADRVSSCANPTNIPNPCPDPDDDTNGLYDAPSCGVVQMCTANGVQTSKTQGFGNHAEHDLALAYLEEAPVGITPARVIVGTPYGKPWANLYGVADIENWLEDEKPTVTLVGYGQGSIQWQEPGDPTSFARGRDHGTTEILGTRHTIGRPPVCDGTVPASSPDESWLYYGASDPGHAWNAPGDSGAPVFAGSGPVHAGAPLPDALDPSWGLSGRFVVAAVSRGSVGSMSAGSAPTYSAENSTFLLKRIEDLDGDGIQNDFDNCVAVPNPSQDNCNAESELDRGGDVLGDACDPNPCPDVEAVVQTEVKIFGSSGNECWGFYEARIVQPELQPVPIASHHPFSGAELASDELTYHRFCQPDPALGSDCGPNWRSAALLQLGANPPPAGLNPWLPMTFWSADAPYEPTWTYPSSPPTATWDYWGDRATWIDNGWITDPGTPAKHPFLSEHTWTESSGLSGVLGLRAGETLSVLGTQAQPMNGVHDGTPSGIYGKGAGMANHFEPYAPDPRQTFGWFDCVACDAPCMDWPWDIFRWCPTCLTPMLGFEELVNPGDLILTRDGEGQWGFVHETLGVVSAPGLLSDDLTAMMDEESVQYLGSVEPYAAIGVLDPSVQGVFIERDGTALHGLTIAGEGGFDIDTGVEFHAEADARFGFAGVFSRAAGGAFIVGGTMEERGEEPVGEILFFDVRSGGVGMLDVDYAPQHVLAATFNYADGRLWVLDAEERTGGSARLTTVDPLSGAVETMWEGERSSDFTAQWLVVDKTGSTLLFGSNAEAHCVADLSEPAEEVPLRIGEFGLVGAPMADGSAVQQTLSVEGKMRTERVEELELPDFGSVGSCL